MPISITFTGESREDLIAQISDYMDPYRGKAIDVDRGEPEPTPKAAKAKKASPRPPVAETEAIEVPPVDATENDPEPEVEQPVLNDTIADEKVKAEVIRTLQSIYNSGKVQVIRHVLSKYGEGAKSFPEIEASRFPAIREALARGEIA